MLKKIQTISYNSSLYLLMTLGILVLLTSVLWLLGISISIFNLIASLIIAGIITYKLDNKYFIITILISLIFIIISISISSNYYDLSDDGNSYHKETIGMLSKGWNPVYKNYSTFAKEKGLTDNHSTWATHYPKTTWIIGSSIYVITKNIETAKSFNILICFIAFGILFKYLNLILKNKLVSLITTLAVIFNPIMLCQIFSLYLDGFMGILFFMVILLMYHYVNNYKEKDIYLLLASLLILLVNCKFTGLAYAGIFCLGYYMYYLYTSIKNKQYISIYKSISYFVTIVIVSVLIVGSNSYIKNIITNKNPFYPLMGKGKMDIMTYLQPASFKEMIPLKKNYYSIFSKTANIGVFNNGEPVIKKPFTYSKDELYQVSFDTRIGGYGVYFSGILILSAIIIAVSLIILIINKKYKTMILTIIPLALIFLLLLFLSDGWWARYAPYLYLVVLIALVLIGLSKNKLIRILFLAFSSLIFLNCYITTNTFNDNIYSSSKVVKNNFKKVENKEIELYLSADRFTGILYNLEDYNVKYTIKDTTQEATDNDEYIKLYNDFAKCKIIK